METTSSPPPQTTTPTVSNHPDPDLSVPKHLPPPFTNGVLKRHKPRHQHLQQQPVTVIIYKECLKNHAATMGGHAVDGCGEFMPSPTSTRTDPTSLKCAACGCHRNFHRRDPDETFYPQAPPPPEQQHLIEYQPHHRHHPPPAPPPAPQPIAVTVANDNAFSPADSPSPPPISSSYYPSAPHMLLALSSGGLSVPETSTHTSIGGLSNSNGKKRFRTKFTQDQKQKMHELAEHVGWKMQKRNEDLIIGFCNEIGVDKGIFKVWMHNNKMTFGNKKDSNGSSGMGIGLGLDFMSNNQHQHERQQQDHHQHQQEIRHHDHEHHVQQQQHNNSVSSGGGNVIGTNGSSSSS